MGLRHIPDYNNKFHNIISIMKIIFPVMESRDLVSVSRLVSRPIFATSVSKVSGLPLGLEGYWSRSQAYCLETFNIARIWLSKISEIHNVSSLLYL